MTRININDSSIILDDMPTNWGGGVWLYNGKLFTGVMYEYFPNSTQIYAEAEHRDGVLDGRQVEYWPNGILKEEYFQKYDYYIGSLKSWDENGQLISHQENDEFGNWVKTII